MVCHEVEDIQKYDEGVQKGQEVILRTKESQRHRDQA